MGERLAHGKRLKRVAFLRIKRLAVAAVRSGSRTGRTGVRTMQPPSCTVTVSWSPTFYAGEIHQGGVEDDALGVSDFGDGLGHEGNTTSYRRGGKRGEVTRRRARLWRGKPAVARGYRVARERRVGTAKQKLIR
jgi:hypothetical protein